MSLPILVFAAPGSTPGQSKTYPLIVLFATSKALLAAPYLEGGTQSRRGTYLRLFTPCVEKPPRQSGKARPAPRPPRPPRTPSSPIPSSSRQKFVRGRRRAGTRRWPHHTNLVHSPFIRGSTYCVRVCPPFRMCHVICPFVVAAKFTSMQMRLGYVVLRFPACTTVYAQRRKKLFRGRPKMPGRHWRPRRYQVDPLAKAAFLL